MAEKGISQEYAPTEPPSSKGGLIAEVEPGSPAWKAGLRPGMTLTAAQGRKLRDLIDWYWLSDGSEVEVEGVAARSLLEPEDLVGFEDEPGRDVEFTVLLRRDSGQGWGLRFSEPVFDRVITCRNRCTFCFMAMMPKGMRSALYLRDDDYRLSFLQGNFITLTNMSDADVKRVITCGLSPLHVSLHAISPEVREKLIGPYAPRGIEVLLRLLAAGIRCHCQIVLVPGVNDGAELDRTLSFIEEQANIPTVGIVPLGYTRFQTRYRKSFDLPADALAVIRQVLPYQRRARKSSGLTRFQLGDEFYLNAGIEPPPADEYDGFPQFEDGIGMLRSFLDAWQAAKERIGKLSRWLSACRNVPQVVSGVAFCRFFSPILAQSPLSGLVGLTAVENRFFGGNVDVAGILTGTDIVDALREVPPGPVLLPEVILNGDGLTLDGMTTDGLRSRSGRDVIMVSCTADGFLTGLEEAYHRNS